MQVARGGRADPAESSKREEEEEEEKQEESGGGNPARKEERQTEIHAESGERGESEEPPHVRCARAPGERGLIVHLEQSDG